MLLLSPQKWDLFLPLAYLETFVLDLDYGDEQPSEHVLSKSKRFILGKSFFIVLRTVTSEVFALTWIYGNSSCQTNRIKQTIIIE